MNIKDTKFIDVSSRTYGGALYFSGLNADTIITISNSIFEDAFSVKGAIIYSVFVNRELGKIRI